MADTSLSSSNGDLLLLLQRLKNMEKSLLRSNKDDAFRFLEAAFSVAATRWPQDLLSRRLHIIHKLYYDAAAAAAPPDHEDHTSRQDDLSRKSTHIARRSEGQKEEIMPADHHEKKKKKKKRSIITSPKIPVREGAALCDNQATIRTDDHHNAAAAQKASVIIKKQERQKKENNYLQKKKKTQIAASNDHEETRSLELANINNELNQVNKRNNIHVVDYFHAQNNNKKKMKKINRPNNNNLIITSSLPKNKIPSSRSLSVTKIPWKKFKEDLMS